jgi:CRISPR-associated endonuclease/helicase Cas3
MLGLVHDAGKASCAWQDKLRSVHQKGNPTARVGIDHKSLGAVLACERWGGLGRMVIAGHHGGLTSHPSAKTWFGNVDPDLRTSALAQLRAVVPSAEVLGNAVKLVTPDRFDGEHREMFVRMLFSCLVDADVLDTRQHTLGLAAPEVAPPADISLLAAGFAGRVQALTNGALDTAVNTERAALHDRCVGAAKMAPGIFRLAAPTGSGKTLASMAFALEHAALHGKRRVIVAVPFISITEQNAEEYRTFIPRPGTTPSVLEHHSNVDSTSGPDAHWSRLAAENWDAPVVITTTVQLFESLLGRRPGQARKLHRLANSVIVLDEVQALPIDLLPVICAALSTLVEKFGVTVLLASATQPALQDLGPLSNMPITEIVPDTTALYRSLKRVRYAWWLDPKPSLDDVGRRAAGQHSALVVVNTVSDAATMHAALAVHAPDGALVRHLSTGLCPQHRRDALNEVRAALEAGIRTFVSSTQLIEAGVDIDFPHVFRAIAPADSLQQAAGRANREGRLGTSGGMCTVFEAEDGHYPQSYRRLIGFTGIYFGPGKADPDDLLALTSYYKHVYRLLNIEGPQSRATKINVARSKYDYETVADGPVKGSGRDKKGAFRFITDVTLPVVITVYGTVEEQVRVNACIDRVRTAVASNEPPQVTDLRALQPFTVNLPARTRQKPDVDAQCRPIIPDLLSEWAGTYNANTGIDVIPRDQEYIL